jgi:8-oxo-dGTP pyrophosphatase MutT (NUDIX family)
MQMEVVDAADAPMSWPARAKMALASVIFRHRVLNRWAHKQLPTKRLAAAVLLSDGAGRLLLVKPSYRQNWLVPGGIVERNEPPWLGVRREVQEEIGIEIGRLRLVAMDWRSSDDEYDDSLHFLFDGGDLSAEQQANIRCDGVEIEQHRFATKTEAEQMMDPHLLRRCLPCWGGEGDRPLIMNRGEDDPGAF